MKLGLFLAFEGVEGSGKSTQARLLADFLDARGVPVISAREPGSTPLGERIRETVLGTFEIAVPARSELFLMLAARAAFVEQVVRPALDAGQVVIADRFELSTLAYQGAGRGLPLDQLRFCNRFATGALRPDATILLDLDPDEGAHRQHRAGKSPDRLEREEAEFHRRVAHGYRELADQVEGLIRIGARGDVAAVHDRVLKRLASRFPETFAPNGVINQKRSGSAAESHPTVPQAAPEAE